ncbi:DUF2807 domain-containing protein [Mucilaginibacter hurinus]|uniref:DUF2807 domain-containing protein n=1 Tax=Mucilaginibacter hurinus TaxID=2201324 RepID=A0A367GQR9_9SPHI|nr:head GIN domain-containing protein [Mucilaginibacter hurinus]RCH55600.1 DUF2807 domain-containing protein [Mucilaginibacter hurinus]
MKSIIKIILAAVIIAGSGLTVSANESAYQTEERQVSGFTGVEAGGSFDVYIKQGSTESVKIDAPADVMEYIITEVRNGTLKIHTKTKSGRVFSNKKVIVYVSAKQLNNVGVSGSGNIFFQDGIRSNTLNLAVSGSGSITGKVEAQTLEGRISGSGNMKLTGSATTSNVSVSGSGNYNGVGLKTETTSARVSGSGNVKVNAGVKVDASVSGSGSVRYTGGAKEVSKSKSGSGSISSF